MKEYIGRKNIAILTSHPIQYEAPLFSKINQIPEINLQVVFYKRIETDHFDEEFGVHFKWDIPLLQGYNYIYLNTLKKHYLFSKSIMKHSLDAVIFHAWNDKILWFYYFFCFLFRAPIIIKSESPFNQEQLKKGIRYKIKHFIFKLFFKKVRAFLYIGTENKKFYQFLNVPNHKLFFCPYAVDNERWSQTYPDKIYNDKITILFSGKLIPKKDPLTLLKAFSKLHSKKIELIYVGDGILKLELQRYKEEHYLKNVYFLGFKNQTELPYYYKSADIFVLPSGVGETWGLVNNEAMNFKLPIITSDIVGSSTDLVKHGENGFIFPYKNVDKLTEYLQMLIDNEDLRKRMGKKSYDMIQQWDFSKDIEGISRVISTV